MGIMEQTLQQERYLNGIRRCQQKGVKILFDGQEKPEESWADLFQRKGSGFYQRDNVISSEGELREIRFDWVCHTNQKTAE